MEELFNYIFQKRYLKLMCVLKANLFTFFVQLGVYSAAIFIIATETYNIPFGLLDFVKIISPKKA